MSSVLIVVPTTRRSSRRSMFTIRILRSGVFVSDNVGVGCIVDCIGRFARGGDAVHLSPMWEGGFFAAFLDGDGVSRIGWPLSR